MSKQKDASTARGMAVAADLRVVIGKLKRRLREQTYLGDLTWSQVSVLGLLERKGPATVTTLAKAEGMRCNPWGTRSRRWRAAGLITGTPDPNDGRQTIMSLTPACRELVSHLRAAREDWLFRSIQTHSHGGGTGRSGARRRTAQTHRRRLIGLSRVPKESTMAVTTLDPKTALIVVDLQKGIVSLPTVHPIADVIGHASALAAAFRSHGLPVVLVNAVAAAPGRTEQAPRIREFPAGWSDLIPELEPAAG